MNWIFWLIVLFFIFYFMRQSLPVKGVKNIHTDELLHILDERDKQFVDVRTPMEYNHYKIRPFQNIPLQTLRKECKEQLDPHKEVVLICRSGSRSLRAARILKRAGFTNLTNVVGGMNHWTN